MRQVHAKLSAMARHILLGQGILTLLFGLSAMLWPSITSLVLTYLFATFLLADGSVLLILGLALEGRNARSRVVWGLLQVLLGLYVLYNPNLTFAVLIIILGLTLLVRGVFNLTHAVLWTRERPAERLLHAILGALGLIVGVVVVLQPTAGGLAFVWVLGIYALVTGSVLIALALGTAETAHHTHHHATPRAPGS